MARTAKRKRTTRKVARTKRVRFDYDRPMQTDDTHTVGEAYASADYAVAGLARRAHVTVRTFGQRDGTYPDTSLSFALTRYTLRDDAEYPGKIDDLRKRDVNTEFQFYADEIEAVAHALMEAVRIGKEQGVIPAGPYTGPTPPPLAQVEG